MKLNDPFGRLASRHQKGYEAMRTALKQGGITTPEAAEAVMKQAWERAVMVILIALGVTLAVALVLPKSAPLAFGLGLFVLVWVVSSSVNGRRYIRRYIDEELGD